MKAGYRPFFAYNMSIAESLSLCFQSRMLKDSRACTLVWVETDHCSVH